jgi:hypothetical protein
MRLTVMPVVPRDWYSTGISPSVSRARLSIYWRISLTNMRVSFHLLLGMRGGFSGGFGSAG